MVDGVVHYCVANMPGAVARTSTFALNNATIGPRPGARRPGLAGARCAPIRTCKAGLNVASGKVTFEAVAQALGYDYTPADALLELRGRAGCRRRATARATAAG